SGLAVLFAGGDVVAFAAVTGLVMIAFTLASWRLADLRPVFPTLDRTLLGEAWVFVLAGFPFLSWQITQLAYSQIDRLLLGLLAPAAEVGWYAAANRIVAIPIFIPTLIITPLFPALSRSAHNATVLRQTLMHTIRVVLLLTVPLSAGSIVLAGV